MTNQDAVNTLEYFRCMMESKGINEYDDMQLQEALEKAIEALKVEVAYTCDQQQCANCSAEEGFCYHTTDIHHAVNFKGVAPGRFMEEPV